MLVLAMMLLAAKVDPTIRGSWEADLGGIPFTVVIGDGTCALAGEPSKCSTAGGKLVFHGEEGDEAYGYALGGGALTLTGPDLPGPLVLRKRGGAPATTAPKAPAARDDDAPRAAGPVEPAAKAQGPSTSFTKEAWGATFPVPGGWRAGEKDGMVLLGGDTEAGIIVVRFFPNTTRAQAIAAFKSGLHEAGVNADPIGEPVPFAGKKGLAGELAGQDQTGAQLKIRTVALFTNEGATLSVVGITSVEKYATLKARTDAVAAGAVFKKPPRSGALAGNYQFIYVSKSGSYSREASINLCQSGRFTKKGEMAGSGSSGSAVAWNGDSGTWTAVGDAMSGTISLTFDGGGSVDVPYQTSTNPKDRSAYGAAVQIGNDLYQKTGAGGC